MVIEIAGLLVGMSTIDGRLFMLAGTQYIDVYVDHQYCTAVEVLC